MKRLRISVEGKTYEVEVELLDESQEGAAAPRRGASARRAAPATPRPAVAKAAPKAAPPAGGAGEVPSPLAAVVVSVDVAEGATVEAGQKLVTLEAMKMNTIVSAPDAGTVQEIHVAAGDGVEEGQALVTVA